MKYRSYRPSISTLVTIILLCGSLFLISKGSNPTSRIADGMSTRTRTDMEATWSLSGDETIENAASSTIIGESMTGPGGRLGSYLWSGDINGDGYDDIAISAPHLDGALGVREGGLLYLFYGSEDIGSEDLDLETAVPDLIIRGGAEDSKLLTSFAVGDIDNDGNVDLVLGIPSQPSCGRLYILWGKGTWSGEIDLHDPGKLNPNGDPYGFLRNDDYLILAGHIAPVPWPESDYKIGQSVVVADLDGDSYDDVVFSAPGWNKVNIIWGGSNRLTIGNEMTIIQDYQSSGLFGQSVISMDMNGNGMPDLAISGPFRNHQTTQYLQTGTVMVIFDAGDLRGTPNVGVNDTVRPFIYGNDPYDNFGRVIISKDINRDGRDDLIVGAPYSDGPDDLRYNSGSIHVFLGGQVNQFPQIMDSESGADILIYGGSKEGPLYPGDKIGTVFEVLDMNGDSKFDLVIGYPDFSLPGAEKAGMVAYYPHQIVFSSPPRTLDMKDMDPTFRIFGMEMQDRLGYGLCAADIDGDGAYELLISSPSSDGVENTRPSCGEVHVIKGSFVTIDSIHLSGEGTENGIVLCGRGNTELSVAYGHSDNTDLVESLTLTVPDLGLSIFMPLTDGDDPIILSPYSILVSKGPIDISGDSVNAKASTIIEFTWSFPSGLYDVMVVARSSQGNYSRTFLDGIESKDVLSISESYRILRNGERIVHSSVWFGPGDLLEVEGLSLNYDMDPPVKVDSGPFEISVLLNGDHILSFDYETDFDLNITVGSEGIMKLTVKASPKPDSFPSGLPTGYLPSVISDLDIEVRIDVTTPEVPVNPVLDPVSSGYGRYSNVGVWDIRWEDGRSNNGDEGSGIWAYEVATDDGRSHIAIMEGGLLGTYYNDDEFMLPGLYAIDSRLDFNWGKFPPKPEVIPLGFSIRWHGWIMAPEDLRTRFTIWGNGGEALLSLDGKRLMDWGDVEVRRVSPYIDLEEGQLYYIELYFRQIGNMDNSFHLRWDDLSGNAIEIPSSAMKHPSNRSTIEFIASSSGAFNATVRAIDWVGLISEPVYVEGIMDLDPPYLDLSEYNGWFNSSRVEVRFGMSDPSIEGLEGSGIEDGSIAYRLMRNTETDYSDPLQDGIWVTFGEDRSEADVMIRFELDDTWKGFIQLIGADRAGNVMQSSSLSLGIDTIPPTFDIVQPSMFLVHTTNTLSFALSVQDKEGSGVDGSTIAYRIRRNQTQWSDWITIGMNTTSEFLVAEFTHVFEEGVTSIQFMARDLVGNTGVSREYEVWVKVPVLNQPPFPMISSPVNGSRHPQGHPVILDGSASTDDGLGTFPELRFTWSSNRTGLIATEKLVSVNTLTIGWHRITLFVDDGSPGHNVSTYVDIYVMRIVDPNGTIDPEPNATDDGWRTMLIVAVIAVILIAVVFISIFAMKRYNKKDDEEVRIDYKEETDDDIDYMLKSKYDDFGLEE